MLQIKTVIDNSASKFDEEVNAALADGWTLTRRLTGPTDFVAELEKEIIPEDEKTCENCKYRDCASDADPCSSCTDEADKWEAVR